MCVGGVGQVWGGMVLRFALCDPCARVSREPCVPRLPPRLFTGTGTKATFDLRSISSSPGAGPRRSRCGLACTAPSRPGWISGCSTSRRRRRVEYHTLYGVRGGFLSFWGRVSYRIRILMYFDVSCMYPACILKDTCIPYA